ncbi:uncharacterized protein LOC119081611 [Bradysia coprophila]|uniref:uncharacterized protein LOC119081611 n=1 Tax=Bradysia coprophila TaxID=38358 RepID=UPI00187DBF1E|nr:uncharacterized protein LOC119081611 [Bradysia coprophila]
MAKTLKIENGANVNCFVPNCSNKKIVDGNPIHFFRVPQGNEGLHWKVAVNSSMSQHDKKIGILKRIIPRSTLYCCELHFNIETDSIIAIDANGSTECSIRSGIYPSIKPSRSRRLWQILGGQDSGQSSKLNRDDCDNDSLQSGEESEEQESNNDYVSFTEEVEPKSRARPATKRRIGLVAQRRTAKKRQYKKKSSKVSSFTARLPSIPNPDPEPTNDDVSFTEELEPNTDDISLLDMSTFLCNNFEDNNLPSRDHADQGVNDFDGEAEIKFTPMMPLTIKLMKRKSLYYIGLEPSHFNRLLRIINRMTNVLTDSWVEMKIMLGLRKQRLNEEFEVLGDLFDIEKTTAEQYYTESKNLISDVYHSLTSPEISAQSNGVQNPSRTEDHQSSNDDESSTESSEYEDQAERDSDVVTDDFSGSDSTEDSEVSRSNNFLRDAVECPICKARVGPLRLDYHMQNIHLNPLNLNKTICGLCFEKFRTYRLLRDHQIEVHDGASCMCDICGKMFSKLSGLRVHIHGVHAKDRPFLCHLCGASYFTSSRLRVHEKSAHLHVRSYACKLCDKKYYQDNVLQAHIRSVHTGDRKYPCRVGCGKSFCRSGVRHTHEQMHKVKYSCEICSKVFSFRNNLQTHCRNIHGRNVIDTEKCKIQIKQ